MQNYVFFGLTSQAIAFAKEVKKKENAQVMGFDRDNARVELYADLFDVTACEDVSDPLFVEKYSGITPEDVIFIFIKENVETNLICCQLLTELGVSNIFSVYKLDAHKRLLERLGVKTSLQNDRLLYSAWDIRSRNGEKSILYLDMDGVLADLGAGAKAHPDGQLEVYKNQPDEIPGVFRSLPPISGAIDAVMKLLNSQKFDIYILTTAPWNNPSGWMDKRLWISDHFGDAFEKKMIISHRKDLLIGDYLIDDRNARGASEFSGEHLHFGWNYEMNEENKFKNWEEILNYLLPQG